MEYNTSPSFYNSSNKKNNWYYNTEMGDNSLKDKMRKYSQGVRNKTKRNGSYKPPIKINNLFVDVNEEDSKYYKLNYPRTNTKTDKNNNFLKRLRYSIPISNFTKSKYEEHIELPNNNNDDKRSKLIAKLIYNSELRYAHDFQRIAEEESESKEYKIMQDRIEVLKKNNIDVRNIFEENEKKKIENNINNEVNKDNNININNKENNIEDNNVQFEHLISEDENDVNNKYYNTYSNSNMNKNKLLNPKKKRLSLTQKEQKYSKVFEKRKPIVNSFEFYIKIKDYIRNKVKKSKEKENQNSFFKTAKNSYRNNSFPEREKNKSSSIKDELNINSNDNYYYTDFAFNNRNNKREKEELQKFIKEKEEIRKKSADKLKKEENNRCLHNYLNFAKLQKSIDKKKNRILLLKQNKKVKNKYYVGNISKQNLSYRGNQNSNFNVNEMVIKKNKSTNREDNESNKEMTKEIYDNFIITQEDRIKKGDFIFDNKEKNKEDKKQDYDSSFEKEIFNAEKAVKKSNEIVNRNNLNKFLIKQNDDDNNYEIKED